MITVYKFSAPWCVPCKRYNPIIDSWADSRDDVSLRHIDIDGEPGMAKKYGVQSVPFTLFLNEDHTPLGGVTGALTKKQLNSMYDKIMGGIAE